MKLEKIKQMLSQILVQLSVLKTDKAVLMYDEQEIAVGVAVYVEDENGERKSAENGEYTTEDKRVITVVDGRIETITEPTEEDDVNTEDTENSEVVEQLEETETIVEEVVEETVEESTEQAEIEQLTEKVNKLTEIVNSILEMIGTNQSEIEERFSKIESMSASLSAQEVIESNIPKKSSILNEKMANRVAEMNKDWRTI